MRARTLGVPILVLMLFSTCIVAAKPEKLIDHTVYEGTFGDPPEMYTKAVFHGTMIVTDMYEVGELTLYEVKSTVMQKFLLYELVETDDGYEAGEFIATLKLQLHYIGTVTTLGDSGGPTEAFFTGKMVFDQVINIKEEGILPEWVENAHWVVWYEEGVPVRDIGYGNMIP